MIKALDELDELQITTSQDDDEIEETVVYLYLAVRLKPLINQAGMNENRINNICDFFAAHYFESDISLDLMINSLYNYINEEKQCPSNLLLTENIEEFLDNYSGI